MKIGIQLSSEDSIFVVSTDTPDLSLILNSLSCFNFPVHLSEKYFKTLLCNRCECENDEGVTRRDLLIGHYIMEQKQLQRMRSLRWTFLMTG